MSQASGLAASIRGSSANYALLFAESDTFDLAGQNVSTIANNMRDAFRDALPLDEMIRITFITGAGKLGRQKYDDNAAKTVTSTLRDLGFVEDRGASCVKECAGSFKLQHDTGKNLKTVVVFPNIQEEATSADGDLAGGGEDNGESIFGKDSPEEMVALSSKNVFDSMIKSRCQSWSQKKGCLAALADIRSKVDEMDQKLLQGQPLSDQEQAVYDDISASALEEKQAAVKKLMVEHVDSGRITSIEKSQLLSQVSERLESIESDLAEARSAEQPKKVERLTTMKAKAETRKEKIQKLSPCPPGALKHQAKILSLHSLLGPLLEIEEGAKGRLLTVKETQTLARKDEILDEITDLQAQSRGWFEDESSFAARVAASDAAGRKASKAKPKKKSTTSTRSSGTTQSAWMTTATKSRGPARKPASRTQTKKPSPGGVFAAMMDSDSD